MPEDANTNPPSNSSNAVPPAGFSQEQLHAAIEKARLEERTKIRGALEAAEQSAKDFSAKLKTAEQTISDLTGKVKAYEAAATATGVTDVKKLVEEAAKAGADAVKAQYDAKFQALETDLTNERTTRQKLTIEQRRNALIATANGRIIPQLVRGDTEEELLRTFEEAKQAFEGAVAQVSDDGNTLPTQQNTNGNGGPSYAPPLPLGGSSNSNALKLGGRRDMKSYAADRKGLLQRVSGRYSNQPLR